jgi:hypothetical protein
MNGFQRIQKLGEIGEDITSRFLRRSKRKVEYSSSRSDDKKDLIIDEQYTCEVKTCQPFVKKKCLSFRPEQLRKCRKVDELYFVTIPALFDSKYPHNGKLFSVHPKKFKFFRYTTKNKVEMIGIPLDQPAVKEVYRLNKREKQQLMDLASSFYRTK